jgi:cation transporter-like permease
VVIEQYLTTGQVLRIPMAIGAAGLFILSALSMTAGIILSSINRRAEEIRSLLVSRWG